jgi:hypothetical protein
VGVAGLVRAALVSRVRLGLATADEALRNLAARPQVAIAIYDSHRAGGWSALYMAAVAEELEDVDVALEAFNRRSEAQGLRAWSRAEVVPRGEFRLYCATAGEQFVLDDHDRRLPVHLQ